jgi:glutamate-1-semialdehyde 2,1-aminomutase
MRPTSTATKDIMARNAPEASITAMLAREEALFIQRNPNSKRLSEDAAKNWLKGVPMHWMVDWGTPFPLLVLKAQGVDITDADGNGYIDFCSARARTASLP